MNTTRRTLLALSVSGLALAACAGTTVATLASDVQLVDSGAGSLASAVMQLAGVPAATITQIQGYLAIIDTGAAAIAATGTTGATTIVQQIVAALKALVPVVMPLIPGGSPLEPVANALLSLVPALLAYIGISGASAAVPVYTPDQARLILRAAMK
jgi:hypothetical protein